MGTARRGGEPVARMRCVLASQRASQTGTSVTPYRVRRTRTASRILARSSFGSVVMSSCEHAKVTVTVSPVAVSICHCTICRKLCGAPFSAQALCKAEQVKIEHEGEPTATASSANVDRCRCAKCGSPIYASLMKGKMIAVPLSVLNTRASDDLKPTHHMYYGQRIVECAGDGLPKFLKSKGELWTPESDAMM